MEERVRVSLEISPEMKRVIDALAEAGNTTQADVLRRAVALLKVVSDAKAKGETPALLDKNGEVTAQIVGT